MTEGGGRSWVPSLHTCCCLLPLEPGVKLIAFAELIVCSGLFLYTLIELTRGPTPGIITPEGDILYLHYTALVDVIFAIYLLIGVYFRKPHYAKFWSLAQSAHLLVSVLITVYRDVATSAGKTSTPKQIIEFVITTALDAYFILVVYSYYREYSKKNLARNLPQTV